MKKKSYGGWCQRGGCCVAAASWGCRWVLGRRCVYGFLEPRRSLRFEEYSLAFIAFMASWTAWLCAYLGVVGRGRSMACCRDSLRMVCRWDYIGLYCRRRIRKLCLVTLIRCETRASLCSAAWSGIFSLLCSKGTSNIDRYFGANSGRF